MTLILILDAAGPRLGARGVEVNLQVAHRFQCGAQLQVGRQIGGSRRRDAIVEPSVFVCLVNERIVNHTECKAQTGSQDSAYAVLSEGVAHLGHIA